MSPSTDENPSIYRGRFAPSPTGELHMGSLVAAVASYLEAKTRDGEWLVRIEDLDPPREVPGSAAGILRTLERCGFEWHGEVLYQSTRHDAYIAALETLVGGGDAYPCACSRADVASLATRIGPEGPVYPGTCRNGLRGRPERAIRFRVPQERVCFDDRLQGRVCQQVAEDVGDFIVRRADGPVAYQLAVIVDDHWQGVTDVVRGADLLSSTPRQLLLQRQLRLPTPGYLHIPLLLDESGAKLSKQSRSLPVDAGTPAAMLVTALRLLQQSPPSGLEHAEVAKIWEWAVKHWMPEHIHGLNRLSIPGN